MAQDEEGFLYPQVNESNCVNCGLCESVCPFEKIEPARLAKPISYAVKIKDFEIREKSSSGGFFSVLANEIIAQNGVVYGAAMCEGNKSAQHIRVDSFKGLEALRTSKYLQSAMNDIYKQVLADLKIGKKVLFSGVPCQINGLRLFLRKEYENLLCVEVICHGVPSPALWKKYVEYLEKKYTADIQDVNFRSKKHGWNKFGLTVKGDNIEQYESAGDDPYMRMFLRDYCLRPSCYDCNAKRLESMADLTIADFWGINNVIPEFNDDIGVSLV
ncbi:MAG: Coenzyme F420 hydrogenase/dehydrogenase, beta subunit C-terminal domain, partial [Candidatus Coproplasma sp.]